MRAVFVPDGFGFTLALFLGLALLMGEKGLLRRGSGLAAALCLGVGQDLLVLIPPLLVLAWLGVAPRWRRGLGAGLFLLGLALFAAPGPEGAPLHDFAALREHPPPAGRFAAGLVFLLAGAALSWREKMAEWGGAALLLLSYTAAPLAPPAVSPALPLIGAALLAACEALYGELAGKEGGEGVMLCAEALFGFGIALFARGLDRPDLAAPAFTGALGLTGLTVLSPLLRSLSGSLGKGGSLLAVLAALPIPGAAGAGFLAGILAGALGVGRAMADFFFLLVLLGGAGGLLTVWAGLALARALAAFSGEGRTTHPAGEKRLGEMRGRLTPEAGVFLILGLLPGVSWSWLAPLGAGLAGAAEPPHLASLLPVLAVGLIFLTWLGARLERRGGVGEEDVPLALVRSLVCGALDDMGLALIRTARRSAITSARKALFALHLRERRRAEGEP